MDSIAVNGFATVGTQEALLDSGNPFISSNLENIGSIYSAIPGSAPFRNTGLWTSTHVAGLLSGYKTDSRANDSPMRHEHENNHDFWWH